MSRAPGPDKRSRAVRLTDDGHRESDSVRATRSAYLAALTADLSADEVATLRNLPGGRIGPRSQACYDHDHSATSGMSAPWERVQARARSRASTISCRSPAARERNWGTRSRTSMTR